MLRTLALVLLCLLLTPLLPAVAEPAPAAVVPPPLQAKDFAPLWADKTATVTPEALAVTIANLKKQQADPEYIVLFIHGFDVARDSSTQEFDALAGRVKAEFAKTNTRVACAGLQWESKADGSVFNLDAAYFEKIPLARSVGHGPGRQLALEIQKAFPKARLCLMAHSMGCEVAAALAVPEIVYGPYPPFVAPFAPTTDVMLHMAVLCGSDLDYNAWARSHATTRTKDFRCRMLWATVAPYLGKGDEVLSLRARIRGTAAGAAFPLMTLEQLDDMVSTRRIVLDGENIPHSHAFEKYYDAARVARVVPTMLYVANPTGTAPPELAEIEEIMAAPADADALLPFLDSELYGSLFYTIWRLERMNCGDARHMTDGTLAKVGKMLKDTPQKIWHEQAKSPCVTVQKGQFPSPKMMTRAGAPPRTKRN